MIDPTARQLEFLRFIDAFTAARRYAPSVRDFCEHFKLASTNGVHQALGYLTKKGLIERATGTARALWLTSSGLAWLSREQTTERTRPVPPRPLQRGECGESNETDLTDGATASRAEGV